MAVNVGGFVGVAVAVGEGIDVKAGGVSVAVGEVVGNEVVGNEVIGSDVAVGNVSQAINEMLSI